MSDVLARWNLFATESAMSEILPCCGSKAWAGAMVERRPFRSEEAVLIAADEVWRSLAEADWREAFQSHPRIGESSVARLRAAGVGTAQPEMKHVVAGQAAAWSQQEQSAVAGADESAKIALAQANQIYEARFNRIFIVCAAGKSPEEVLKILKRRLQNDDAAELQEAAEQQRQITQIRLKKWLQG